MDQRDLIVEIEIPLYIREYVLSESVRVKYYEKGKKKLPNKYCNTHLLKTQNLREPDGVNYIWKDFPVVRQGNKMMVSHLTNAASGKRIEANADHVGKRNVSNINGQAIYNGNASPHARNKMIGQIKDQYKDIVNKIKPFEVFPLRIYVYIFDTVIDDWYSNGQDWDVDNRFFPYGKAFADTLKAEGKIPDDNVYYITEPPHAIFVPVDDSPDRKLLVRIYKDNRPIILNNFLYRKIHGDKLNEWKNSTTV